MGIFHQEAKLRTAQAKIRAVCCVEMNMTSKYNEISNKLIYITTSVDNSIVNNFMRMLK